MALLINKIKIGRAIVERPPYLSPTEVARCCLHCNIPEPFSCSPEKPVCAASWQRGISYTAGKPSVLNITVWASCTNKPKKPKELSEKPQFLDFSL